MIFKTKKFRHQRYLFTFALLLRKKVLLLLLLGPLAQSVRASDS